MRIRKRFPPSDPHLNHSSTVAVQQRPIRQTPLSSSPPPDHPAPIRTQNPNPGWALSGCDPCQRKMEQKELELEVKDEEDERITTGSNDSKKDGISNAHQDSLISQPFSSFDHQGRWCGGEREVPLKERRGGFGKYVAGKGTMKSKTNKKCVQENGNDDHARDTNNIKNNNEECEDNNNNGGKKSKRGSEMVEEGSRCSRVNGRGWRCCQQTLVGYSMCEHHLGKGRVRSVNNNALRNRSQMGESTSKSNKADNEGLSAETSWDSSKEKPLLLMLENVDDNDDDDDNDRKKPSIMMSSGNKKRMKIGMVKARSISSLLGLTDNLGTTKAAENEGIFD